MQGRSVGIDFSAWEPVMRHLSAIRWTTNLASVRERMEALLEHAADAIKDALLDWEPDEEAGQTVGGRSDLPQLDPALFVAALLPQLEPVLWRMADAINDAPAGRILSVGEARVRELLADFCCAALETGVQMRLDAAETARPPRLPARGTWAWRWRRMHAAAPSHPDVSPSRLEATSKVAHP